MANQYPPSGALFPRKKTTPQSPDHTGDVEIDQEMLSDLAYEISQSPDGRTKLRLACWNKMSRQNTPYMSIKPSTQTESNKRMAASGNQGGGRPQQQSSGSQQADLDDNIPF